MRYRCLALIFWVGGFVALAALDREWNVAAMWVMVMALGAIVRRWIVVALPPATA